MRLGAPADHVAPAAADENDLNNVVIVALNKKTGGPFLDKDGVALEAIVLTPQSKLGSRKNFLVATLSTKQYDFLFLASLTGII